MAWVLLACLSVLWVYFSVVTHSRSVCAFSMLLILCIGSAMMVRMKIYSGPRFLWECLFSVILAILLLDAMQKDVGLAFMNLHKKPLSFHLNLLNILCVLVLQFLFLALTGNLTASSFLTTLCCLGYALASFLVVRFRNRELIFQDFSAFRTAVSVLDNYELPDMTALFPRSALPICFCVLLVCVRLPKRKPQLLPARLISFGMAVLCAFTMYSGSMNYSHKVHYFDDRGTIAHGLLLDLVITAREAQVVKPEGYAIDTIENLETVYPDNAAVANTTNLPDVVIIMSEAFSDLSCLGDLDTNIEVLPTLNRLRSETISGYMISPVIGGNTVMPEWECLTGHTTSFFAGYISPFQQYMSGPSSSAAHYLHSLGYHTTGMHPYRATGWNRNNAYQWLGFEDTVFVDDFPQKDLVRKYVSDRELYREIIETLDSSDDAPQFIFAVSMQNHGGYNKEYDVGEKVFAANDALSSLDVNMYLSLVHETDRANADLLEALSKRERPTYVLFFGDHQPQLPEAFYNEIQRDKNEDQAMIEQHMVPFFLWSNQGLEAREIPMTSANYLVPLLFEAANIPQSPYFSYLLELRQTLPAITAFACYSAAENAYLAPDALSGKDAEALLLYEQLQYNGLFDKKHQSEHFFGIEE